VTRDTDIGEDNDPRLDGSAAAGIFQEVFAHEMSAARGACTGCGGVAPLGAQHLYMAPRAPGAVLRCHACGTILMVLIRGGGRYRLALSGLLWIEMEDPAAT
jgi:ribosomal protein S27E